MSTPPPSPPPSGTSPGWFPDPWNPAQVRYWDGSTWTGHTAARAVEPAEQPVGPTGTPYASFGRRLVGLLIDNLIIGIPVAILLSVRLGPLITNFIDEITALPADASSEEMNRVTENFITSLSSGTLIGIALVSAGITLLYFGVLLHVWGRTVGGQLMGIRCVDSSGQWPTWRASFIRAAIPVGFNLAGSIPIVGIVAGALSFVNYLAMLWSPTRQAWMDRAAGTFVVRA